MKGYKGRDKNNKVGGNQNGINIYTQKGKRNAYKQRTNLRTF